MHPEAFNKDVPNPWTGVTTKRRVRKVKAAVDRDLVYEFAWKAIEAGYPEPAAAAVICFEWLQRPENVLAGCITWSDYRGKNAPTAIKVEHHKTGAVVWHPLEEVTATGAVKFYTDAEAVLAHLPRRGVPLILRGKKDGGSSEPYTQKHMAELVRRLRNQFQPAGNFHARRLPPRRHDRIGGGGIDDGARPALSGHRTDRAYSGYAKVTMERALAATRKRYAHRLANEQGTYIQNERSGCRSE